jgi:hypothetical protein
LWLNYRALDRRKGLSEPVREGVDQCLPLLKAECERRGIPLGGWRVYAQRKRKPEPTPPATPQSELMSALEASLARSVRNGNGRA